MNKQPKKKRVKSTTSVLKPTCIPGGWLYGMSLEQYEAPGRRNSHE